MSSSSVELSANSTQMSAGSHKASERRTPWPRLRADDSECGFSGSGMEETTTNLASVATATEQMTSTIGEIAGQFRESPTHHRRSHPASGIHHRSDESNWESRRKEIGKVRKPSRRFPHKPTCWRSTPLLKRPAPVLRARGLPSLPMRSKCWRNRPRPQLGHQDKDRGRAIVHAAGSSRSEKSRKWYTKSAI